MPPRKRRRYIDLHLPHNHPPNQECSTCHRRDTEQYPITLQPLAPHINEAVIRPRQFGDRAGMVRGHLVCSECLQYFCSHRADKSSGKWKYAWPAVLWTCLTRPGFAVPHLFMQFFPLSLRHSWYHQFPNWTQAMQEASQTSPPHFKDVTHDVITFRSQIQSGLLAELLAGLNALCYPVVRCPVGCFMYIDDVLRDKLVPVPAKHYFCLICPTFKAFDADALYFQGARQDWTTPYSDLDWIASPSLLVSEENGLSFLMCAQTLHPSPTSNWLHVPTHPILRNIPINGPDVLAPATVSGCQVRSGRTNSMNTSFPVYRQTGNTAGLSTFKLQLRTVDTPYDERAGLARGFVLCHRSDILHYAQQDMQLHWQAPRLLTHYNEHPQQPTDQQITSHLCTGTFLHIEDAFVLSELHNQSKAHTNLNIDPAVGPPGNLEAKDYPLIIHCASPTGAGRSPYQIPAKEYTGQHITQPLGQKVYCLLMLLMNCPPLYEAILKTGQGEQNGNHLRALITASHYLMRHNCQQRLPTYQRQALQKVTFQQAGQNTVVQQVSATLKQLSPTVGYIAVPNIGTIHANMANITDQQVILVSVQQQDQPIPYHFDHWTLMLGISAAAQMHLTFRWFEDSTTWQYAGSVVHNMPPSNHSVFLFTRAKHRLASMHETMMQRCCGQVAASCIVHDNVLIRHRSDTHGACCAVNCKYVLHWCCPYGYPDEQCSVGLCKKHYKDIFLAAGHGKFTVGQYGPTRPSNLQMRANSRNNSCATNHDQQPTQAGPDDAYIVQFADEQHLQVEAADIDDIPVYFFPDAENVHDECPLMTSSIQQPMYASSNSSATSGHYLLNHHLRVLTRYSNAPKPPVTTLQMLQNICSKSPEWSVPLLYPEGMLFPTIFWAEANDSVVGAIPSAFYSNVTNHTRIGTVPSLRNHLLVRVMDNTLLTSHDFAYLQFAFDTLLNCDLNRNSAVVACQRGLEAIVRHGHKLSPDGQETILKFDEFDARREVNRLVSTLRTNGAWTYFITLTCNDSATAGVAPLRKAIARQADASSSDILHDLLQHYSVLLTRAWERTVHYIWKYITESPQQVLGHVKSSWMRFEFQSAGALGNRPHVHGGVTLYEEPQTTTLSRVRCSSATMWAPETKSDFHSLKEEGLVKDYSEFCSLQDLAFKLQQHDCAKAKERCKKRKANDDTLICRVPRHPPSFVHSFHPFEKPLYNETTYIHLAYLDLATLCSCQRHWQTGREFKAGMWHYPAQPDEHFVPTIPRLFVAMQACTNVQVCDRKFQVSYLAKYAAGSDEKRQVSFQTTKQQDEITVTAHDLTNAKISGQRLHPMNQTHHVLGRELPLTEMLWYIFNFRYVVSSSDYTHASTKAPEYRYAVMKHGRNQKQHQPEDGGGALPAAVAARVGFPQWRQFTATQETAIKSYEQSRFYLDQTSSFSVRPPELAIFSHLESYLRWFTRTKGPPPPLSHILNQSALIDGTGRWVQIRLAHILDAARHIQTLLNHPDASVAAAAAELHVHIFLPLSQPGAAMEHAEHFQLFVDTTKHKPNVVVFQSPSPKNATAFSVHLLLTMGKFITELDLYCGPDIVTAFRKAGLLINDQPTEEDVRLLCKRFVKDQLMWLPVGSRVFSKMLQEALDTLRLILLGQQAQLMLPVATDEHIIVHLQQSLQEHKSAIRQAAIDVLSQEHIPQFPDSEQLKQGAVHFVPTVEPALGQTQHSLQEQRTAMTQLTAAIDSTLAPSSKPASYILSGPPGSGKTHLLLIANTYALSRNACTLLVTVTSERARRLGGVHIHLTFGLPVLSTKFYTVQYIVCKALSNLRQNPVRVAFLQQLQILLIEEIGLLSAELLAAIDTLLRIVKDSPAPFGGMTILATGDPHQLAPVDGSPIWTSHHLICTFSHIKLCHYVRAAYDEELQQIIGLMRTPSLTAEQVDIILNIIQRRCLPNSVPHWSSIPPHVLKIFGTRAACDELVNQYLQSKLDDPALQCYNFEAVDEIETSPGVWANANQSVQHQLSKARQEPRILTLFVGQVLRLTYNNSKPTNNMPRFSQGQLCIVQQLPNENNHSLFVILLPPGQRVAPAFDALAHIPPFGLQPAPTPLLTFAAGKRKARRTQYRVAYYSCSTVHRSLGETCTHIASQISIQEHKYRLWDRQQLLVLVSRVTTLDNITLVSADHDDTMLAIRRLLEQVPYWLTHIEHVLHASDNLHPTRMLQHEDDPSPPYPFSFPQPELGFVYMLVSTTHRTFAYVGETGNINRRLREHNSGHGSSFTNNPQLRPWRCLVLIYGFTGQANDPTNITQRKALEHMWHRLNGATASPGTRTIFTNGQIVFHNFRQREPGLIWEQLGNLQ